MTEFEAELRHRCRNLHCRSKLPEPVENERRAFCAKGCFTSYYRHRCVVCERPFKRKRENQHVCSRPSCKPAFWGNRGQFDPSGYLDGQSVKGSSKTSTTTGIKSGIAGEKPWRFVAGPELSLSAIHCATMVGSEEAVEAVNRVNLRYWREANALPPVKRLSRSTAAADYLGPAL